MPTYRTDEQVVTADQIPVAHTPDGGWHGVIPPPVLAGCNEPLAPGAPDLRGLWQAVRVERDGRDLPEHQLNQHVERIEQCGNRVVITSEPVIHDMRADGTLENGVNDVAGTRLEQRIRVAAVFNGGRLDLHPLGVEPGRTPFVTRGDNRRRAGLELRPFQGDDEADRRSLEHSGLRHLEREP